MSKEYGEFIIAESNRVSIRLLNGTEAEAIELFNANREEVDKLCNFFGASERITVEEPHGCNLDVTRAANLAEVAVGNGPMNTAEKRQLYRELSGFKRKPEHGDGMSIPAGGSATHFCD